MNEMKTHSLFQRRVAWLCIALQLAPVFVGASSSVAIAAKHGGNPVTSTNLSVLPSRAYTLGPGESTGSVAKQIGLTIEQLKKYNQFRSFPRPFEQLTTGDEIEIPVTKSMASAETQPQAAGESQLASQVTSLAGTMQDGNFSDAASGMARSMASGAANSAVQQWLGQFGTVEAQINLDEDLSLANSSLDWLVPLYDSEEAMLFAQTGIRNKDDRTTVNLGAGVRTFHGNWMYGANVFFDDDITGDNRRLGLGVEAWTDYLQLSSNAYFGLTDWHQSRDFDDFDERPADGYDVRMKGWLPAYPQIGGKLEYEKYRGDQVALFSKDDLQKDPWSVTAGVNWTPFPLLTLGLDQRMGKGDQNETNVNMQLTWRPGDSWDSQIASESVRAMRQISESRYDLVNRNNNIVLEYQKQDLIAFNLNVDQIRDVSESVQKVEGKVTGKYDLDRIDWELGSFASAGGKLRTIDKTHFELTLPAWKDTAAKAKNATTRSAKKATGGKAAGGKASGATVSASNQYHLTASAVDARGNRSTVDNLLVEVLPPEMQIAPLTSGGDVPADGVTPMKISSTLTDGNGKPIAGEPVEVTVTYADGTTHTYTTTTGPDGSFTVDITSKVPGTATVTVNIGGATQETTVEFTDASADVSQSAFSVDPATIVADGSTKATLTLTLKDKGGKPLSGEQVAFVSSLAGSKIGKVTDNKDGTYSASLTGTKAGKTSVSVTLGGSAFGISPVSVELTADAGNLSASASTLSASPATIVANGSAQSTVTLTLKDANGNLVSGQTVAFTSDLAGSTIGSVTDKGDGIYTATLTGTAAGTARISASVGGSSFGVTPASVILTGDASNLSASESTLTATPATIVANGTAKSTVTLTLKDINGNTVSGQTVTFVSSLAGSVIGSVTDNKNGTYTASLTGTKAGNTSVSVKVGGSSFGVSAAAVALTADASNLSSSKSTLSATPATIVANGTAKSTVTLTLKDGNGNVVSGQTVTFASSLAGSTVGSVTDNSDGTYTATLSGTKAGLASVTANVGGSSFGVSAAKVSLTADVSNLSTSQSTLTASPATIVANGTTASTVTLTLKDANGNLVSGQTVVFASSLSGSSVGSVKDNGNGTYTAALTGTKVGNTSVTVTVGGGSFGVTAASVALTADASNLSASKSTLTASPATIVANGTATSAVKLTLKDGNDNPVLGQTVTFASSLAGSTVGSVTDNGDGTYSATLTGTKAGAASITAKVGGNSFGVTAASVTLTADASNLSASESTLTATPATIMANDTAASTVTLTLKDANRNLVSGQTVTFASSLADSTVGSVTDNDDGTYTATLTGTRAGSASITASVGGSSFGVTAASVTLTADASNLSTSKSALSAAPSSIVANGTAQSTVTLTLKDGNDNPVAGQTVAFTSSLADSTLSSVTDNDDGTYTATLSGTKAGEASVSVKVGGNSFAVTAAKVTLTADTSNLSTSESTLSATPATIVANGTATSAVKLTLKDANGNLVSGQTVTFASSLADSSVGSVTDNGDGTYTATLTGTTAGEASITASVGGNSFAVTAAKVSLTADTSNLSTSESTLTAAPSSIVANGTTASTVTLTLKDANGNLVSGQTVAFASSLADSSVGSVTDKGDGTYTATLTGTTAGEASITASVGGNSFAVTAAKVTLTADASNLSTSESTLSATPATIVANGTATSAVKLTLKDANGNLVSGQTVTFASSLADSTVGSVTDNGDGTYTATLTGTRAGSASITAKVGGSSFDVTAASVTLTADASTLSTSESTLTAAPATIMANDTATSTVTLTLKDANGNLVSGQIVEFESSLAGSTVGSVTDNSDGTYTATLTGTKAGVTDITATVGGGSFGVTAAKVTLTADAGNLSASKSTLTAAPATIVANGTAASTVTLTLKDVNDNLVSGQTVTFTSSLEDSSVGSVTDNDDGTYTATLTGTRSGTASITASVGGSSLGVTAATVTLTADASNLSTSESTLSATPATIVANGTAASTVKLTLKDANGNLVSGQTVTFTSSLEDSTVGSVTDNDDGTYTATLTGTKTGSASITANVGGSSFGVTAASVSLTADTSNLSTSESTLTAAPATIVANGTTTSTVTLTLKDANGNLVSGQTVAFTSSLADSTVGSVTDKGDGTYTATLTGTTAGEASITASVGGNSFAVTAAKVTLTADADNLSTSESTLTAAPATIVANGTTTSTVTLTLKDANGNLVSGQTVAFASSLADSTVGSVTDNSDGTYTATLSGTTAGEASITASVGGNSFAVTAAKVTLTGDASNLSTSESTLSATPATIVANGTATSTVKLTLKDANGNLVSGQTVTFASSLTDSTVGSVTDNDDGTYTATLTGIRAGSASITANVGGSSFDVTAASVSLTADADNLSTSKSTLAAAPATIVANGTTTSTVTLTLKDANGNLVSGQTVAFASSLADSTLSSVTDNSDGTYTATLRGTTAGEASVTASVGGSSFAVTAAKVTLTADADNPSVSQSTLTAAPATIVANGTAASTVTLTLKDANDNAISGKTVAFTSSLADSTVGSVTDNDDGTYTATLKGTKAGSAEITVTVGGSSFGVDATTVTLTADASNLSTSKSTLAATPATIVANGTATSAVKLTLKDGNDNPVSGQTVTFASSLADSTVGSVTDNGDGTYTATLSGTRAGDASVTASVGGNSFDVTAATVALTADADNLSTSKSTLTATPATIVANGTATSAVKLTLKDANDNLVLGQTVTFASSLAGSAVGSVTDNGDGTYTATLTGTKAGTASITANVGGNSLGVTAATVALTADASNLSTSESTLSAAPATIVANGTTTSTVTLTLKDANGNLVSGQIVAFTSSLEDSTVGSVTDNSDGTYTATLTGTRAGDASITASVGGNSFGVTAATVALTADADNLSTSESTLSATPATIVANGTAASTVKLTLKDANGNLVLGQTVTFASSLADSTVGSVTDNGDGTYSASLTGTKAGTASITANVGGSSFDVTAVSVTLTADASNLSTSKSALSAAPATIVANGTAVSTVTLTLKDANDNPVSGQTVTFSSTLADADAGSVTDNGDGTYTAELKGTKAGVASITANVGGSAFAVTPAAVTLTADADNPSVSKSTLSAAPSTIVANDTATSTLTLTLKDANENAISGKTVAFASSLTGTTVGSVTDNEDGTYTATLKGTKAGTAEITVTVGGSSFGVNAAAVILTADSTTAGLGNPGAGFSMATDGAVADGVATNSVKATVTDANGNPVSGASVSFAANNGATITATGSTGDDGSVVMTLTSLTVGTTTVTATMDGTSKTADVHFVAGAPADAKSTLTATPTVIYANGEDITTIVWKPVDANDHVISGRTDVGFSVGSATGVTIGTVTESPEGTYTATLSATTAQKVTISPTLGGTVAGGKTVEVELKEFVVSELSATSNLSVNGATFTPTDGFPTTGFTGAKFQIQVDGDAANNANYNWKSDSSWVSVDSNGNVSFTGTPNNTNNSVKITVISKTPGANYEYTFKVSKWFIGNGATSMTFGAAQSWCSGRPNGYSLPSNAELTNAPSQYANGTRGMNSLWSEWGNTSVYGFTGGVVWGEAHDSSSGFTVALGSNGYLTFAPNTTPGQVVCERTL